MATKNPYSVGSEEAIAWEKEMGQGTAAGAAASTPGLTAEQIAAEQKKYPSSGVLSPAAAAGNLAMARPVLSGGSATSAAGAAKPEPGRAYITNPDGSFTYLETDEEKAAKAAANRPVLNGSSTIAAAGLDLKPRSAEEIRQEQLKQAQAMIDATEALFQEQLADVRSRGQQALQQTSSIGVSAGLAGSPFGQAQQQRTEAATAKEVAAAQAQRQAEIAKIMAAAQDRATDIYDREIARFQKEREFIVGERDKANEDLKAKATAARARATSTIEGLAKSGISLDELSAEELRGVLGDADLSEWEIATIYGASNPALNAKTEVVDGFLVTYYLDPKTGKPVMEKSPIKVDAASGAEFTTQKMDDGTLLLIPKTFDPNKPVADQIVTFGKFAKPEFTPEEMAQQEEAKKAAVEGIEQKVLDVEGLLTHPGMGTAVGTTGLQRLRVPFMVGQRNDFVAKVQQLTSRATLDELMSLKAKGGTLGALNESELKMLEQSATAINGFPKVVDGDGNVVGWKIPEAKFKEELGRIQTLALKAYKAAAGEVAADTGEVTEDEMAELRASFPGMTDEQIKAELGKTNEGSVSVNAQADAKKVANAIGQFESGGNYKALGPVLNSGSYKGDRAYGKYQVMGKNVPSWTKEALGVAMTPQQFLADPKAQDAVAEFRMARLIAQGHGVEDIASIWFSGQPLAKAGNRKDQIGTTVPQYAKSVRAIYDRTS